MLDSDIFNNIVNPDLIPDDICPLWRKEIFMSITTRPNDDYAEYKSESYLDTDWLINDCYPQDMDIMCYEGSLVDNYIGYQPDYQSIVRVTLHSHYPLQTIKKSKLKEFDWFVILETFETTQSSSQKIIYTNDSKWVESIREIFEKELETNNDSK